MKAAVLTATLFFFVKSYSQEVFFDWAKHWDRRYGSTEGYYVDVDASKNVYIVGDVTSTLDADPGPGVYNLTGSYERTFLVKLDSSGNFIWGKDVGGYCRNLTVDPSGNIYMTGNFSGTTDFDPGPGTYNLTATHTDGSINTDIYTLKLNTEGVFQWVKRAGGLGPDWGSTVTVDVSGNVYTTGTFAGIVDFDPGNSIENLGTAGTVTAFITKFDKAGNFIWAKSFENNRYCYGYCIKTDSTGNVYTSGMFEGTVDFDPGASVYNLTVPFYNRTTFLSKLDSNGNFLWVKQEAGTVAFQVDKSQNVFTYDGALSKYDKDGNLIWRKAMGGYPENGYRGSNPIRLDEVGNIYLIGVFTLTRDFDPGPGVYNMTSVGGYENDGFICRLDFDGNFVWVKQISPSPRPLSLAVDAVGNLYITGIYWNRADLDPGHGVYNLYSYIGAGIFTMKLNRCGNRTFANLDVTACNDYRLNNTTYTKSGTYYQYLRNAAGCDSTISLNLTLKGTNNIYSVAACEQYSWNNRLYTASGTYTDTLKTIEGCDSIVNLNLTINRNFDTTIATSICEGQIFSGYTVSGIYTDTFAGVNGCDSTRVLHLTVYPRSGTIINSVICEGEEFLGRTTSGTYIDTLKTSHGCDSIRTINLLVNSRKYTTFDVTICQGQQYFAAGAVRTTSGEYRDTLVSQIGCDSVIITNLVVHAKPAPQLGNDRGICDGDVIHFNPGSFSTYVWQDGSRSAAYIAKDTGQYYVQVTNNHNCIGNDTVRITKMFPLPEKFLPLDTAFCSYSKITLKSTQRYLSYLWDNGSRNSSVTVDKPGIYWLEVVDTNNCVGRDSVLVNYKDCLNGMYLPNAFTPNGDGKNDVFRPLLFGKIKQYNFTVYNRWGQVIFQSSELGKGWNGKVAGTPQETSVFAWTCTYQFEGGEVKNEKGTVTLIR